MHEESDFRRLLTDAAGYAAERSIRLLLSAVIGIFVARYLGPEGLGLLNYATAVFGLLGPVALLGMEAVLVRELSTSQDRRVVLASALSRQLPVGMIAAIAGLGVIILTRGTGRDVALIAFVMMPLPLLAVSGTFRSYLEAVGHVRRIVRTGLIASAAAAIVKIAAIVGSASLWVFGLAATAEALVIAVGLAMGLRGRLRLSGIKRAAKARIASRLVGESWPLLLAGLAVTVYMTADVVMLGLLTDDGETGVYVAAARLSEVWYFLPMSALAAVRPRLARMFSNRDGHGYVTLIQRFTTSAFVAAVGAVLLIQVIGDPLVTTLYGEAFSASTPVLRLHIFAAPFVFLGVAVSQWFIDRGMTHWVMRRSIVGALANVALNLLLIPPFGAVGAATATLISYAVSSFFMNAISSSARPIFILQARALRLAWDAPGSLTSKLVPPARER